MHGDTRAAGDQIGPCLFQSLRLIFDSETKLYRYVDDCVRFVVSTISRCIIMSAITNVERMLRLNNFT